MPRISPSDLTLLKHHPKNIAINHLRSTDLMAKKSVALFFFEKKIGQYFLTNGIRVNNKLL